MTKAIVLGGSRGIGKAISESLKSIDIDIFNCVRYLLSHAGVRKKTHVIRYLGDISYRKLKVEKEPQKHFCPYCKLPLRLELLQKLGGKCTICGETDTRILHVDHKLGHWYLEKQYFKDKESMLSYYHKHFEEESKYLQPLCFNCNTKKRIENKETAGRKSLEEYIKLLFTMNEQTISKMDEFLHENPQFIPIHGPKLSDLLYVGRYGAFVWESYDVKNFDDNLIGEVNKKILTTHHVLTMKNAKGEEILKTYYLNCQII